mmetsp:Transcript_145413/g.205869  ORF Transcript_145413/g.205869 Transcript_145413/m.205869 type:complete len:111 (-) Transcript_145413:169-501(-)
MRNIAAYLLAVLGGESNPSADDINKILSAAGIEGDSARIASLVKELEGKSCNELMVEGAAQLAKFGGGGGGGGGGGSSGGSGGDAPATEAPKEPTPEPSEEEDLDLDLFG